MTAEARATFAEVAGDTDPERRGRVPWNLRYSPKKAHSLPNIPHHSFRCSEPTMFSLPACIQLLQNGSLATATPAIKFIPKVTSILLPLFQVLLDLNKKQPQIYRALPHPLLSAHHLPDLEIPNSQLPFASHNRQREQLERKTGAYCAPNS